MILRKREHAFTLAEVMIVLLVLTLLLAIFAPFITKRRTARKGEDLWHWATRNYLAGPMDAYYNPEDAPNGSLFIGVTPDSRAEIEDVDIDDAWNVISNENDLLDLSEEQLTIVFNNYLLNTRE